jgi:hypothetical protein
MKFSNSFYYDLDFAETSEVWVKELFSGGLKIEVKSDRMAHRTGNVFIEVYSRGVASGISTTLADYWLYRIDEKDSAIIIPTKRLKQIVKDNFTVFTKGGDNDTSLGVLIKLKDLI